MGQAMTALEAVETAAVVISADDGIGMITSRMMDWAKQRGLDRMIIVNKIDADEIDLPGLVAQIQETFGKECLPINLPAANATKVVDCFFNPSGDSDFGSVEAAHRALIDQVVEVDPKWMETYLEQATSIRRSCTSRSSRRCAKATWCRSASSLRAPEPVSRS
jgi:elongation factor G